LNYNIKIYQIHFLEAGTKPTKTKSNKIETKYKKKE